MATRASTIRTRASGGRAGQRAARVERRRRPRRSAARAAARAVASRRAAAAYGAPPCRRDLRHRLDARGERLAGEHEHPERARSSRVSSANHRSARRARPRRLRRSAVDLLRGQDRVAVSCAAEDASASRARVEPWHGGELAGAPSAPRPELRVRRDRGHDRRPRPTLAPGARSTERPTLTDASGAERPTAAERPAAASRALQRELLVGDRLERQPVQRRDARAARSPRGARASSSRRAPRTPSPGSAASARCM